LRGCLFKGRCHHFAGAAPGRPEIDQYRDIAAFDVFLEAAGSQFQRVAAEQAVVAFAATGIVLQPITRHAIHGETMGANDVLLICHGNYPGVKM
jgi:hypothetical protein